MSSDHAVHLIYNCNSSALFEVLHFLSQRTVLAFSIAKLSFLIIESGSIIQESHSCRWPHSLHTHTHTHTHTLSLASRSRARAPVLSRASLLSLFLYLSGSTTASVAQSAAEPVCQLMIPPRCHLPVLAQNNGKTGSQYSDQQKDFIFITFTLLNYETKLGKSERRQSLLAE